MRFVGAISVVVLVVGRAHPALAEVRADKSHEEPPSSGNSYHLTELHLRILSLRGGTLWELGACSPDRAGTWSSFGCWSLNLGKQEGQIVGGDLAEWGVRLRALPRLFFTGSLGLGAASSIANGLICALPGRNEEGTCKGDFLPIEYSASVGAHASIAVGSIEVDAELLLRYHADPPFGDLAGYGAPSGLALSTGLALRF